MKRIVFSLALSIAIMATAMAQETKPVVKASANTTTAYESTESSSNGSWSDRPFIKGARFNAYFDFGLSVGGYNKYVYYGSTVYDSQVRLLGWQLSNLTLGVRIFDYGFVGVQLGFTDAEMLFSKVIYGYNTRTVNMFTQSFPLMLDFRGFFPINKDIHPYIEYAFGWAPEIIFYASEDGYGDLMYEYNDLFNKTRLGVGIDIKRLSLGLGWNCNWGHDYDGSVYKRDYFFIKIGVKAGRRE